MARQIDNNQARDLLDRSMRQAEKAFADGVPCKTPDTIAPLLDIIFTSPTQAYREVLLGCIVVRRLDKLANIRQPYSSQGEMAFNGRSLDEFVINPFLTEKAIPSSRGPYLNVFRRQVQFDERTRDGVRDKTGYDALLALLGQLETQTDDKMIDHILVCVLYQFVLLREQANIQIARIRRISLRQYDRLLDLLLGTPSGGLLPVLIVQSMLETINETFSLNWIIESQGINVSDRSSGAPGDISILRDGTVLMGIEITERPVDDARVAGTFRTKIAPTGIEDYVFMVNLGSIGNEAIRQAEQYFSQGHEVNFVDIRQWVINSLVTVGKAGRELFNRNLQSALSGTEVSRQIKVAWNSAITAITST